MDKIKALLGALRVLVVKPFVKLLVENVTADTIEDLVDASKGESMLVTDLLVEVSITYKQMGKEIADVIGDAETVSDDQAVLDFERLRNMRSTGSQEERELLEVIQEAMTTRKQEQLLTRRRDIINLLKSSKGNEWDARLARATKAALVRCGVIKVTVPRKLTSEAMTLVRELEEVMENPDASKNEAIMRRISDVMEYIQKHDICNIRMYHNNFLSAVGDFTDNASVYSDEEKWSRLVENASVYSDEEKWSKLVKSVQA